MQKSIRMSPFAGLAVLAILSAPCAFTQRSGGSSGGGGSAPSGGSAPGGATRLPPNVGSQTTGPAVGSLNQNIFLLGNVILDDGTPPPGPVTIERVCNGAPRAQAYTDQKGRFSFQLGQTTSVMQDASEEAAGMPGAPNAASGVLNGVAPAQPTQRDAPDVLLANCDLRAVLSGYRSDNVALGLRRAMDDPNVGTIVLHRLSNVEGSAVSLTSLQAPKDARKAYNKGLQDLRKDKPAEAAAAFRKAVEIDPEYAAAWFELGRLQHQQKQIAAALESYRKAIAADSKYTNPYVEMAQIQAHGEKWAELIETTDKLIKLDAVDYPVAYLYSATAHLSLGQFEAAEKSARAGIKLDTQHRYPKMEQALAMILVRKNEYADAALHLRNYLALAADSPETVTLKKELAELDRRAGARQQAKAAAGGS